MKKSAALPVVQPKLKAVLDRTAQQVKIEYFPTTLFNITITVKGVYLSSSATPKSPQACCNAGRPRKWEEIAVMYHS